MKVNSASIIIKGSAIAAARESVMTTTRRIAKEAMAMLQTITQPTRVNPQQTTMIGRKTMLHKQVASDWDKSHISKTRRTTIIMSINIFEIYDETLNAINSQKI